jgi:hypothetical protein
MGEKPELFVELLRQISIVEGGRYDEAYRCWKEGLDLSFRKNERIPEPVFETAQFPPRPALSPTDEPAHSRIIGEDNRRRVLHQKVFTDRFDPDSDAKARQREDYEFADLLRSI